jgi:hypothetical protein
MDPDETLREIRELVTAQACYVPDPDRLAELVGALDEWLSKGGFLPEPWRVHQE